MQRVSNMGILTTAFSVLAISVCTAADATKGNLMTFGYPENLTVEFGRISFGAERPRCAGKATGKTFAIGGVIPDDDGVIVYGLRRGEDHRPQVWRAHTRDGFAYEDARMLFEVPASDPPVRWLAGALAMGDGEMVLLQCELGRPARKGHPFHVFCGRLDGTGWRKLNAEPIYRGQDALSMVWNKKLGKFVNYQTSYQPFAKRFPDNLPNARRVLHIRTSKNGLNWTPGGSFGADGPYLPNEQLITPDEKDYPDTEFYHFSAIDLGEFWAGTMLKYVSQPKELPSHDPWPHGPFLSYEWWISPDGLNWDRPFREKSSLDAMPHSFASRLAQPVVLGHELRWAVGHDVYVLDRRRMFYAYCRANAEVITRELILSGQPVSLEVSFEAIRRKEQKPLRQGYVMAELLDNDGKVIPGFERDKCLFTPDERTRLTLKWGNRHLPNAGAGRRVRLRLYFRDVRLYSASY